MCLSSQIDEIKSSFVSVSAHVYSFLRNDGILTTIDFRRWHDENFMMSTKEKFTTGEKWEICGGNFVKKEITLPK